MRYSSNFNISAGLFHARFTYANKSYGCDFSVQDICMEARGGKIEIKELCFKILDIKTHNNLNSMKYFFMKW